MGPGAPGSSSASGDRPLSGQPLRESAGDVLSIERAGAVNVARGRMSPAMQVYASGEGHGWLPAQP